MPGQIGNDAASPAPDESLGFRTSPDRLDHRSACPAGAHECKPLSLLAAGKRM